MAASNNFVGLLQRGLNVNNHKCFASIILLFSLEPKCAGDIKAKVDVAIAEVAFGFGDEGAFGQSAGVGKYKLENMPACFNIDSKAQRIVRGICFRNFQPVIVFTGKSDTFCDFETPAHAECELVIVFESLIDGVLVDKRGRDLQGKARTELSGDQ